MKIWQFVLAVLLVASSVVQAWAMGNHSDVVRDQYGRALGGATIWVYIAGTTDPADIYSDNGVTVKSNPITSDALDGRYNFYAANGVYDLVFSHPSATFNAAHTARISVVDGSDLGGGASAVGLDDAFDIDNIINGATSARPLIWGNGTQQAKCYGDATLGTVCEPDPLGDSAWRIWPNFNGIIRDEESAATMFTIDPDATDNDKYVWASGYRPIKTVSFPADALYVSGAASLVTDTALVSGGLIVPYVLTTDSNTDYFYRYVVMDPKWDGGTVTATVTVVNVNATPANVYEVDVSGECFPAGTLFQPSISSTGEQPATITFGSSGSCGASACNQNDPASATTVAITLNGTPAGGNVCGFQAQVDATATTETVSGVKVVQMDIHYKIGKGF